MPGRVRWVPPVRSRETTTSSGARRSPSALLARALSRVGWGLTDQAASSLTNFMSGAVAAHLLAPRQLGAFSLALVTYSVALSCSRGLVSDPLLVRLALADTSSWRAAVTECSGLAVAVGTAAGTAVLLVGLALPGDLGGALVALALMLPLLLLQDSWRYAFFALGKGQLALVNDLVWAAVLVPALIAVSVWDLRTGTWFVVAWAGSATVAAAFGIRQARTWPRVDRAHRWLRAHRDLGPRYLAENVAGSAATQARAYGVGVLVGLAGVGHLAVVTTLLGPISIVMTGIGAVMVPELSAVLRRRSPEAMERVCLALGAGLACLCGLWGLTLWVALPRGLGQLAVGGLWEVAWPLMPFAVLGVAVGSFSAAAGGGLHAMGAADRSLRAMLIGGAMLATASVTGAAIDGVRGALMGTAISCTGSACLWWRELHAEVRSRAVQPSEGCQGVVPRPAVEGAQS